MSTAFHHVAIIVSDLLKAKLVYGDILGLEQDIRPDLNFAGLFYSLGGGQQLHIMLLDNPDSASIKPKHGGRYRHFALSVSNLEAIKMKLEHNDIVYTQSKSGREAIFFYDFDGNAVELIQIQNNC
ncbi:VOC family protein [Ghiorsea bivora]|uniref:VOC family protein n=1 Tax=Ghiorsea bivora TaxID=1485545 RepID=UPI000571D5FC|nr:VOC family protein [Ghiorsea bivora]